jgi:hypothetical protein
VSQHLALANGFGAGRHAFISGWEYPAPFRLFQKPAGLLGIVLFVRLPRLKSRIPNLWASASIENIYATTLYKIYLLSGRRVSGIRLLRESS